MDSRKCCFCGTVRNCGSYLDRVLAHIEALGAVFDDYAIVVYYDVSTDDSWAKLVAHQKRNTRIHLLQRRKGEVLLPFRTHRLALARNRCLEWIRQSGMCNGWSYFVMMDMDDVHGSSVKKVRPDVLEHYLKREAEWDALSFQTAKGYYDIWALSLYPFCFSYNHFRNNYAFHRIMGAYVNRLLDGLPPGGLLPCYSSFNGFSIYKTAVFADLRYDGRVRTDLVPPRLLEAHRRVTRSGPGFVYKQYERGHIDGRHEDCEHRAFHYQGFLQRGARIRIAPDVLFPEG